MRCCSTTLYSTRRFYLQVDQLFSCLCPQLKDDILTIEELKQKIVTAPITPVPTCNSLNYIYDWKNFITDKLTHPPLKYQSKYNSFLVTSESSEEGVKNVKLYGKKLPQDVQLVPRSGIRLIKEGIDFVPVKVAGFRIETVMFDEIIRGLQIHLAKLPSIERRPVMDSWDRLRDTLENIPNRSENFPLMKIRDLPEQSTVEAQLTISMEDESEDGLELTGDKYPEYVDEGDIDTELSLGTDVCVYTNDRLGRPWVGRVLQILEYQRFIVHWFTRKTCRSSKFTALKNADGSNSVSEVEYGAVMFWDMSENRTMNSFTLSEFWLRTIEREYDQIDNE